MTIDRRENKKLNQDDLKKILNRKQLTALRECQYFGWKLKFIRYPLFQEPVPVLCNARIDQIGILDPDGCINMDLELELRSSQSGSDPIKQLPEVPKSAEATSRKERRQHKVPVPDNPDELLSQHQMRALRHIESFGWQLHFVRRSLFQEPVAALISPEGDRFAILEHDGRINMTPDTDLRKEASVAKTVSTPSVSASKIKGA
ncbi:MAG: hypothetical protein QNL87_12120 [Gammaproteobacteria bacterium]|nr:hypothetical protein [Gammaproteobacteria bacterium]